MSSPDSPITQEADDACKLLRSIQCTCRPTEWREGEADYVCFCGIIDEHDRSDRDDSRQRSCSPPSSVTETYDSQAESSGPEVIASKDGFDGPSVPSERYLSPAAVSITEMPGSDSRIALPDTPPTHRKFFLTNRNMRALKRQGLKSTTNKSEIERRVNEDLLWEIDDFVICIARQWFRFHKYHLEIDE